MAVSPDSWRAIYNLFDPKARLEATDQDLFVDRLGSVAAEIADDMRLGLEPRGKWLVCGSMGSGKSSELVRLGTMLTEDHVVVALDLPRSVARIDLIRPAEVLFLIGAAAVRAAREGWAIPVPDALLGDLVDAFRGLLPATERTVDVANILEGVALFVSNLAVPGSSAVVGAATGAAKAATGMLPAKATARRSGGFEGVTRKVQEGDPDLERLRDAVDAILAAIAVSRRPVVLVDGLDKIQDLGSIRDLFTTTRTLCSPAVQIVYTAPITLMLATEWQPAGGAFIRQRLANLVIRQPDLDWVEYPAEKVAKGVAAMRSMVAHRLLRERLGVSDVFASGALEHLIEASGGLVRDLVHLVNRAVRTSLRERKDRIDLDAAQAAVQEIRNEYEVTLTTRRVEELRHVRQRGEPSGTDDVSADLLLGGYVLPYSNGRVWFEPHPIFRGLRPGL